MLRVLASDARAGMVLAAPVLHPRCPGTVLLREGLRLNERIAQRLRDMGLREVWVRYPGLEVVCERVSPAIFAARTGLARAVGGLFDAQAAGAHARLEFEAYRDAVAGLMERILVDTRAALYLEECAGRGMGALRHATGVAFLALLMGLRLRDYLVRERSRLSAPEARDVTDLGVGAMLHDVGMLRLPGEVVARWNAMQDESDPSWREHVRLGFEMVQGGIGPGAAGAVLHHHQRFDGTGFPAREALGRPACPPRGAEVHIFARILGAADLFDRLRRGGERFPEGEGEPPEPPPVPVVRVLRALQSPEHAARLDPMVLRALLAVVPPYAPGSLVTLSDGRPAAVVDWDSAEPCRPTVRPVNLDHHARARSDDPEPIDLRERPELSVAEAEGADVRGDNFYAAKPGQFDFARAERALFNAA